MCEILILFFKMSNVDYGSFLIETLFIVNTLISDLLNLVNLDGHELCIQNNQPSWILLVESCDNL